MDVSDSSDWLETPLQGLARVEAALRCQMCKDLYKTPMITSCSHTFCSLCIRHALSHDGRCPLCRTADQALKLRNNWSLDEAVEAFNKARNSIMEFAKKPAPTDVPSTSQSQSPKRKLDDRDQDQPELEPETKRTRSSMRLRKEKQLRVSPPPPPPPPQKYEIVDSEDEEDGAEYEEEGGQQTMDDNDQRDETYHPEPEPDDVVPCPVCQQRMKSWKVFSHLDTCPGPQPTASGRSDNPSGRPPPQRSNPFSATNPSGPQYSNMSSLAKGQERLPSLSYSLLKDTQLRRKMSDLGLSTTGSRQLLEKRHKEWTTIWNANCDSARPKKRSQLLQDLSTWEKTIGKAPDGNGGGGGGFGGGFRTAKGGIGAVAELEIKDKEFNGTAWAVKHDDGFKDLVANAMRSRQKAQQKTEEGNDSEAKDDRTTTDEANQNEAEPEPEPEPEPELPSLGDTTAGGTEEANLEKGTEGMEGVGDPVDSGKDSTETRPTQVEVEQPAQPASGPSAEMVKGTEPPALEMEGVETGVLTADTTL